MINMELSFLPGKRQLTLAPQASLAGHVELWGGLVLNQPHLQTFSVFKMAAGEETHGQRLSKYSKNTGVFCCVEHD